MTDGLDELRRINHTTPESVEGLVAMDRQELMAMLKADSGESESDWEAETESDSASDVVVDFVSRSKTRVGYIGAVVAAAAVAIVGILMITGEDAPVVSEDIEPAEATIDLPAPLVVEGAEDLSDTPDTTTTTQESADQEEAPTAEAEVSDAPEQGAQSEAENAPATIEDPVVTTEVPTVTTAPPTAIPTIDGPFDQSVDLLVLHFDFAHLDDGHSAAASLEIAAWFGLQPLVVAGTRSIGAEAYVHPFDSMMQTIWGDAWLDAKLDRPNAINRSTERWLAALDAGGRVWIAEGGVSDFTAEVLQQVQSQRPGLDTQTAVHVVQHSGTSESSSRPESMSFVRSNAAYKRIDDGNSSNGTAHLNQQSTTFESAALAGQNSTIWSSAFEYLPAAELDFSDTVGMLHIVGIGTHEVANPDDFANRFMR